MEDTLVRYIKEELLSGRADVEVGAQDDLLGSGLVDSLGMMRLIAFIETECGCKIPTGDITIENFMTVEAIAKYVAGQGATENSD